MIIKTTVMYYSTNLIGKNQCLILSYTARMIKMLHSYHSMIRTQVRKLCKTIWLYYIIWCLFVTLGTIVFSYINIVNIYFFENFGRLVLKLGKQSPKNPTGKRQQTDEGTRKARRLTNLHKGSLPNPGPGGRNPVGPLRTGGQKPGPPGRWQHCQLWDCHPGGSKRDPHQPEEGPEARGGNRKVEGTEGRSNWAQAQQGNTHWRRGLLNAETEEHTRLTCMTRISWRCIAASWGLAKMGKGQSGSWTLGQGPAQDGRARLNPSLPHTSRGCSWAGVRKQASPVTNLSSGITQQEAVPTSSTSSKLGGGADSTKEKPAESGTRAQDSCCLGPVYWTSAPNHLHSKSLEMVPRFGAHPTTTLAKRIRTLALWYSSRFYTRKA